MERLQRTWPLVETLDDSPEDPGECARHSQAEKCLWVATVQATSYAEAQLLACAAAVFATLAADANGQAWLLQATQQAQQAIREGAPNQRHWRPGAGFADFLAGALQLTGAHSCRVAARLQGLALERMCILVGTKTWHTCMLVQQVAAV